MINRIRKVVIMLVCTASRWRATTYTESCNMYNNTFGPVWGYRIGWVRTPLGGVLNTHPYTIPPIYLDLMSGKRGKRNRGKIL